MSLDGRISLRHEVNVLKRAGWVKAKVISHLHVHHSIVDRWWDRDDILDKPRSGRPIKYTRHLVNRIVHRLIKKGSRSSTRIVAKDLGYPRASVQRVAHAAGLVSKARHHHPFLSDKMKTERVAFARAHKNDDFTKILFVDEKKVHLCPTPNKHNDRVWVFDGEEPEGRPTFAHSAKLNVAAGVSASGRSAIYIFPQNMDQALYKTILQETLIPAGKKLGGRGWVLFQDKDPKHTSKSIQAFLAEERIPVLHSPTHSPDFNAQDNVWSMFDYELSKLAPNSVSDLRKKIKKAWQNIPQKHIQKTVLDIPNRLREAITLKGGWTHH